MEKDQAAVPFAEVESAEAVEISARRGKFKLDPPNNDTLGLAISGGGIRSATFSLGILQRLAERNILKQLDYISTVSGGGYIGSWLYSWIRREQAPPPHKDRSRKPDPCENADPAAAFTCVASNLGVDNQPEAPEITFLRSYSNYLTPRVSFFSADTWVVGAIWARNTLLNLAILVALFASVVLAVRGLALLGFQHLVWPGENDEWSWALVLCAGLLLPMVGLIGWNLWWASTIALRDSPPKDRRHEQADATVMWFCISPLASAIAYSFWLARSQKVFVEGTLLHGIAANFFVLWPAFFFLQVCARLYDCHIAKRSQIVGKNKVERTAQTYAVLIYLIGPAGAAFATAALLRAVAFVFSAHNLQPDQPWFVLTWGPPLVLLAFTLGMVVHIGLMGRDLPEASREWLGRLRGWLMIVTALWIIVFGVSIYGPWLVLLIGVKSRIAIATLGAGWILSTAAGLFAGKSDKTSGKTQTDGKSSTSVLEIVAEIAPYVFMLGFALMVAFGTHAILVKGLKVTPAPAAISPVERYDVQVKNGAIQLSHEELDLNGRLQRLFDRYWLHLNATQMRVSDPDRWALSGLGLLLLVLGAGGGLLAWRVDINVFSMHNFYKNRLVRCYLGASNRRREPSPFTGFDDFDDTPLNKFTGAKGYCGPYPIINATLNVTSGGKLQYQERQAESFIFSPLYTGFCAENPVNQMRLSDGPHESLASYQDEKECQDSRNAALDPGGAPAYRPSRLAGGGVHLGMAVAISGAAASPNMGYHTSTPVSFLLTVFNVRLGWWLGNALKNSFSSPGPGFGLAYAVRELLGMANADSSYVNLSDGGHFDNMGIYELVRRRCRYIVCCDGEQDEELTFNGIGNAIRKCRTDFGIDIDLPVTPLRKVNGFSSAHCVVGRIKYTERRDGDGYLLYLKTTLTGDEATDVLEYHSRQPDFPHQTTGDQWFDESQFESYRKLGYHIADKALCGVDLKTGNAKERCEFFNNLCQIWYPPSAAVDKNSAAHTEMYNRILEDVRRDDKLADLDPALFQGYKPPAANEWNHNSGHLCNSLIQLMERVFYDLNLEDQDTWQHPYVQGWLDIFGKWVHSDAFQKAWAVTNASYPERFCRFYNSIPAPLADKKKSACA